MADEKKPQEPKQAEGATPGKEKSTSKLKAAVRPEEGTVVSFADKMWIQGTGNSKHLASDKKYEVNRIHGEQLIKKGAAKETTAPPKAQPKPKKAKSEDDEEDD
jgi:hypothetical protein